MASKVKIPGSGQSIDFGDPLGSLKSFVMAAFAFMLAIAAGVVAEKMYNAVADNTPDQVNEVDLI